MPSPDPHALAPAIISEQEMISKHEMISKQGMISEQAIISKQTILMSNNGNKVQRQCHASQHQ